MEKGTEYYRLAIKLQNAKKQWVIGPPSVVTTKRYAVRVITTTGEEETIIGEDHQLWNWNSEKRTGNDGEAMGADERVTEVVQSDLKNYYFAVWNMKFVQDGVLRVEVLDIVNGSGFSHNPALVLT